MSNNTEIPEEIVEWMRQYCNENYGIDTNTNNVIVGMTVMYHKMMEEYTESWWVQKAKDRQVELAFAKSDLRTAREEIQDYRKALEEIENTKPIPNYLGEIIKNILNKYPSINNTDK